MCLFNPFVKKIKDHIASKIKINVNYGLILMPTILKKYFKTSSDFDPDLDIQRASRKSKRENSLERKSKKTKASRVIYQSRVLNFLIFVRNNILEYHEKRDDQHELDMIRDSII